MAISPALRGISSSFVVAAYSQVRLTPQAYLPDRHVKSAAGALHLPLFEQPGKDDFFSSRPDSWHSHFC
jgi:hypothetical protein